MLFPKDPKPKMTIEDEKAVKLKIDRAKIALMMENKTTFFSALLANLKLMIDRTNKTAATDAIHLWMNPDFVYSLETDETVGLMLHEVMHVALDHCNNEIYKDLNQYVLGMAMDYFINFFIVQKGFVIPKGGYYNTKYRGKSSLEIYHELMKNPPPPPPPGWQPDVLGIPDGMDKDEYKEKVETNIIKAVLQAEMADDIGSVPGDILLKVQQLLSPELPWNLILLKYMDQYARDDYSFSRPNKRYLPDYYLPELRSEQINQVTFGLDVSGSMTSGEAAEGMAEFRYIKTLLKPKLTHLMTFDTHVHINEVYEEFDDLPEAEIMGGGGTIIEPLIERIVKDTPEFAIIFTDGYFGMPSMKDVKSDIYWVIKGNPGFRPPDGIGEVIHLN